MRFRPIVYTLQTWMIRWPIHWSAKYALIVVFAIGVLLGSYHYFVRSTFVGQFLNGRRYPRSPSGQYAANLVE